MSDRHSAGPGVPDEVDPGRSAGGEPSPERLAGMRFLSVEQYIERFGRAGYERQLARLAARRTGPQES